MAEHESKRERYREVTLDPEDYVSAVKRTSWGAVFAGVVAALGLQLLLTALGTAIGFTALSPDQAGEARRMGVAAGLWWLITGTISLFVGGWVAGRLSGVIRRRDGGLHGFVTWGATALLGLYFATTTLGDFMGASIAASDEGRPGMPALRGTPIGEAAEQAGQAAREAQQQPEETARKMASYATGASWWMFLGLLLGAIASAVGGYIGTPTEPPSPNVRVGTITRE